MAAEGAEAPQDVRTVMVSFFTNTFDKEVSEAQTFSVPITTTRNGLSTIVNTLLGLKGEDEVPFDFLYNDEFITIGLDKFLKARPSINTDDTLALEYTPSLSMQEGNEVPHDDWVSCVATPFLADAGDDAADDVVVTGCYDRRVRLCLGTEVLAVGDGHKGAVKALAAVPTRRVKGASVPGEGAKRKQRHVEPFVAVSGGKDCSVRFWRYTDSEGLRCARALRELHTDSVDAVDVSPNAELVVAGSWDKTLTLLKLSDALDTSIADADIQTARLAGHSRPVLAARFSTDGLSVYSTGQDGGVKAWDVTEAEFKSTFAGDYCVYSLDVCPHNPNYFLTGHSDNRARLWDTRERRAVKTFSGHLGWVHSVRWAPEGCLGNASGLFVTAGEDASINLYDIRAQRQLANHDVHTDGVLGVAFTRRSTVASGSKDTTVRTTQLTGYDQSG